jgi:hypothetical protein
LKVLPEKKGLSVSFMQADAASRPGIPLSMCIGNTAAYSQASISSAFLPLITKPQFGSHDITFQITSKGTEKITVS